MLISQTKGGGRRESNPMTLFHSIILISYILFLLPAPKRKKKPFIKRKSLEFVSSSSPTTCLDPFTPPPSHLFSFQTLRFLFVFCLCSVSSYNVGNVCRASRHLVRLPASRDLIHIYTL